MKQVILTLCRWLMLGVVYAIGYAVVLHPLVQHACVFLNGGCDV